MYVQRHGHTAGEVTQECAYGLQCKPTSFVGLHVCLKNKSIK